MHTIDCEVQDLLRFLGGHPEQCEFPTEPHQASLEVVARGARKGLEQRFRVCDQCALNLTQLNQHLNGWIESCHRVHSEPLASPAGSPPAAAV